MPGPASTAFVQHLHLFRGLAILQIAMLHGARAFLLRGYAQPIAETHPVFMTVDILFHGATLYFALISGILYAQLFAGGDQRAFYKGRLRSAGAPYLFVTALLTIILWRGGDGLPAAFLHNLLHGDAWNTLWYVPVILALYLASPVLNFLASRAGGIGALVLILLPLVVSRTGTDLTPAMLVYFGGAYMLGLVLGQDLERRLNSIAAAWPWLAVIGAGATATLIALHVRDLDYLGPVSVRESFYYVQKLSIGLLMLTALRVWARRAAPLRDTLLGTAATISFGIYFLHGPLMRVAAKLVGPLTPDSHPWWGLAIGIAATFLGGLTASLAIIALFQRLLGRRSRLLIGA